MSAFRSDSIACARAAVHRAMPLVLLLAMATASADLSIPGDGHAHGAPLAPRSLILDGDAIGAHMVVVGERGHVLVSRDGGLSWTQGRVPTRVTLTGISLFDLTRGWAVGHDAVILRTRDGGYSWELVFAAPEQERPLLDVWFESADRGFAVGAYGLFLETRDGGDTWEPRRIADGDDHLNHIASASSKRLYVAAERGGIYRSDDGGRAWKRLPSPYAGSFFGTLPLDDERVYVYGLRGQLFHSADAGETWRPVHTGNRSLVTGGIRLGPGQVLFTGMGGTLLAGETAADTIRLFQRADRSGIAGALDAGNGTLVLFGEFGVDRIEADQLEPTR